MRSPSLWVSAGLACLVALTACGLPDGLEVETFTPAASQTLLASGCSLPEVTVRSYGRVVYVGEVDLDDEVERIARGIRLPYRHDGGVFQNREGRLPAAPRGFYHEYVHLTAGLAGPGPQRLIRAGDGPFHYTPDHYDSFLPLPTACMPSRAQD